MKITSKHLEETAKKATGWLASRMTPLGNYKGNQAPDKDGIYTDTDDIGCYYKSVYPLCEAGQARAAGLLMTHVVKRFQSPEGDFFNTPEVRSSGSYDPIFCHLYQNAWLM